MSGRKGKMVVATVAAAVIGLVGLAGLVRGQAGEAAPQDVTPVIMIVEGEPGQRPEDRERLLATVRFEIRSRPTVEAALASHPEILKPPGAITQKDPVSWMTDMIGVKSIEGTDLIQISCQAPTPQLSVMVADAVADAFIRGANDRRNEEIDLRMKQLEESRMEHQHRVAMHRDKLRAQMRSSGDDIATPAGLAVEADDLREVRKELRRVRLEKAATAVRLERTKAREAAKDIPELSDAVAALTAQEQLLIKAEQAGAEALRRAELARLEFQSACDEIARAEGRLGAIEDEIQRLRSSQRSRTLRIRKFASARLGAG
jgi:hypothetical protein